jgi:hypothetical protein
MDETVAWYSHRMMAARKSRSKVKLSQYCHAGNKGKRKYSCTYY